MPTGLSAGGCYGSLHIGDTISKARKIS